MRVRDIVRKTETERVHIQQRHTLCTCSVYCSYTQSKHRERQKEHWVYCASLFSTPGIMNTTTTLLQLCYRLPKIDAGAGRSNNKWILIFRSTKLFNCHAGMQSKKKTLNANRSRPYSTASCCFGTKLPTASTCPWQCNWFLNFTYRPWFQCSACSSENSCICLVL